MNRVVLSAWLSGLLLLAASCQREAPSSGAGQRIAPNPHAPAAYGSPTGSLTSARAPVPSLNTNAAADWQNASFAILQTELSPAILVRSQSKQLELFAGTTNAGLSAPTYVAWSTMSGPRTFKNGESLDIKQMRECWVLVWWAGAAGWTNWDAPWVVFLQHQPEEMRLDGDGLHFRFGQAAGDVVLLPLYGYEKLPQAGDNFLAQHGMKGRKVQTWDWPAVLKRDPLTRIRYWAAVTRQLPIACEESISVDSTKDSVTLRSRFEWHTISDDWQTPKLKVAPMPPPLGHAASLGGFPVRFSKSWFDLDYFTPYGPYLACEGVDQIDATFSVLQFVHETEANARPPTGTTGVVSQALGRLQDVARREFAEGTSTNIEASYANSLVALARATPFCDAGTRSNVVRHLHEQLAAPPASRRMGLLPAWWAYAHFTDDWALVKERWPLLKQAFLVPRLTHWVGFGSEHDISASVAAATCLAFTRMAYRVGDMDSYRDGCAQLARELVLLFLRQRGAEYFRTHQPWHSREFIDPEVFLTYVNTLEPFTSATLIPGWNMDGPSYPAAATGKTETRSGRAYELRWARFWEPDLARFYRENLFEDVRRELNWLQNRLEPAARWHADSVRRVPLVQLRSLLLNEPPELLAGTATPEQFTGTSAGIMASCLAVLRTAGPTRFERLIPALPPGPFADAPERDTSRPLSHLITWVSAGTEVHPPGRLGGGSTNRPMDWPVLLWPGWSTPTGARWTFGAVRAEPSATSPRWTEAQLNRVTRVLVRK